VNLSDLGHSVVQSAIFQQQKMSKCGHQLTLSPQWQFLLQENAEFPRFKGCDEEEDQRGA